MLKLREVQKDFRSSSNKWPRTSYRDYLHRITNFRATVLNIFSKEIISNKTKCRKQLLKFIRTLESTSTTKLMSKFYLLLHNFSDSYNLFSRDSIGSCLWCYFSLLFISLAFRKCKKVCNILKIILVLGFCHGKPKLLDSLSDFILIIHKCKVKR